MKALNMKISELNQKKMYFSLLYFTEGAPIGFLLIALPTFFREKGLSIEMIASFSSILILPWTLKFVWSPVLDTIKTPRINYQTWMIFAQLMMGLTLIPLLFLNLQTDYELCLKVLLVHSFFSSIQDIAIDSLAISITQPEDQGKINGWMQIGQVLGRSVFGGGAILMLRYLTFNTVVTLLISVIFILGFFAAKSKVLRAAPATYGTMNLTSLFSNFKKALLRKSFFIGALFALTVLSAEKGLAGLVGPFLLDRGIDKASIGTFLALPALILTVLGSLVGGYAADRFGKNRILKISTIIFTLLIISAVSVVPKSFLIGFLCPIYFLVGVTITTSASLLMAKTDPKVAATQFSSLMGMINLSESYSVYIVGKFSTLYSYPFAVLLTCGISFLSLIFLRKMEETQTFS